MLATRRSSGKSVKKCIREVYNRSNYLTSMSIKVIIDIWFEK